MRRLLIILLFAILLSGCETDKNDLEFTIDIVEGIKRNVKMPLSYIADNIAFIPLETKEECIVGQIRLISFSIDYMVVIDELPQILLFNKTGKFVRKIGNAGEFFSIYGSVIVNNELFVWDIHLNGTLCYDLNTGKCIRAKKHDFYPSSIDSFKDSVLVYYTSTSMHDKEIPFYHIYTLSLDFNQTDSLWIDREYRFIKNTYIDEGRVNTYLKDGRMYIRDSNLDTVFYLTSDLGIKAGYRLFLGKHELPDESKYNMNYINYMKENEYMIDRIIEINRFLFIEGIFGRCYIQRILYDKTTKKSRGIIFNLDIHDAGFHNDIDGSIPFWPKGYADTNVLYDYISPYELKRLMNNPYFKTIKYRNQQQNDSITRYIRSAKITDNPVIFLATIKN